MKSHCDNQQLSREDAHSALKPQLRTEFSGVLTRNERTRRKDWLKRTQALRSYQFIVGIDKGRIDDPTENMGKRCGEASPSYTIAESQTETKPYKTQLTHCVWGNANQNNSEAAGAELVGGLPSIHEVLGSSPSPA